MLVVTDKALNFKFLEGKGLMLICSPHLLYVSQACFQISYFYFYRQFLATLMTGGITDNPRDHIIEK